MLLSYNQVIQHYSPWSHFKKEEVTPMSNVCKSAKEFRIKEFFRLDQYDVINFIQKRIIDEKEFSEDVVGEAFIELFRAIDFYNNKSYHKGTYSSKLLFEMFLDNLYSNEAEEFTVWINLDQLLEKKYNEVIAIRKELQDNGFFRDDFHRIATVRMIVRDANWITRAMEIPSSPDPANIINIPVSMYYPGFDVKKYEAPKHFGEKKLQKTFDMLQNVLTPQQLKAVKLVVNKHIKNPDFGIPLLSIDEVEEFHHALKTIERNRHIIKGIEKLL